MTSRTVKVGIMPYEAYKKYTIGLIKGTIKRDKNDPQIWFSSIKTLANVLSEENLELLQAIIDSEPHSIKELEMLTHRKANNLLRTLRTMEQYGLVQLQVGDSTGGRAPLKPKVVYNKFNIILQVAKY